ncbi:MAG: GreA/GreB family elongation factor, partial [Bacteroidales bacterium]|nr:GreA/GreB family elongation factor [Bacteroidales bacterium]
IDPSEIDTSQVQILNTVKLLNKKINKIVKYTIVAESEADIKQNKISVETPIAKGLLGKKAGDIVDIQVPSGVLTFEILEITI